MGSMIVALLLGCTTPKPTDAPVTTDKPAFPPKDKAARSKQKAGKGKFAKGKGKTKTPPGAGGPPPIGVAGPATGDLTLVMTEVTDPPPAPPVPGAPPPPSGKSTAATLALEFSDGTKKDVPIGKVPGLCTETIPKPIGPEGKQQTPLWAVECVDGTNTTDIAIAQIGQSISVLRAPRVTPGTDPQFKIVKRVRLVQGVTLSKKQKE